MLTIGTLMGGYAAATHPEETQKLVNEGLHKFNAERKANADKDHEDVAGGFWGRDPDDDEKKAGMLRHRCTDVACLLFFLVSLGVFCFIYHHAYLNQDIRKLYYGFDFLGHMCGNGTYSSKPFLFYCERPGVPFVTSATGVSIPALDFAHPVCVEKCPESSDTWTSCYAGHTSELKKTDSRTGSFDEVFHYTFKRVADYPSIPLTGRYCVPQARELAVEMQRMAGGQYADRAVVLVKQVYTSWPALLCCVVVAILCGYGYLLSLRYSVKPLVWLCLWVPFIVFTLVGLDLIAVSQGFDWYEVASQHGFDLKEQDTDYSSYASTGDHQWDLYLGVGLLVFGLTIGVVICCGRNAIKIAIRCIQASVDCIDDMPTILLNPLLNVLSQTLVLSIMLVGFVWLISCGEVEAQSLSQYVLAGGAKLDVKGLMRSFTYEDYEYGYIIFYLFMFIWIFEVFVAVSQFTLIYAVELWYFTPYRGQYKHPKPTFPLWRGLKIGLVYHLGSLAFGAFLVAILRTLRIIGEVLFLKNKDDEDDEKQNDATRAACACCECCLRCFERIVQYVNKNAYMGVAMHSSNYCPAALEALSMLTQNGPSVMVLNGVTNVLQIAGVGMCALIGYGLSWLMLSKVPYFSDPTSHGYVFDPVPLCVIGAVVSAAVIWVFMLVVDTVSDTILYCFVVDRKATENAWFPALNQRYAPDALKDLVQRKSRE